MRDGRLKVGDKLLSVNQVSLVNQSLQFAAQRLLAIQPGRIAIIGVCHSLSKSPDISGEKKAKDTEEEVLVPAKWTTVQRRSKRDNRRSTVSTLNISTSHVCLTHSASYS